MLTFFTFTDVRHCSVTGNVVPTSQHPPMIVGVTAVFYVIPIIGLNVVPVTETRRCPIRPLPGTFNGLIVKSYKTQRSVIVKYYKVFAITYFFGDVIAVNT